MAIFWSYGLAMAAFAGYPIDQPGDEPRSGQVCVLWPSEAHDAAERRAKAINLSWAYRDDKTAGHTVGAIELLEVPSQVGAEPRAIDFKSDPKGIDLLIEGHSGRYLLTLVPREGRGNEYNALFGKFSEPGFEYTGACHTILVNQQMIADLRRRRNGPQSTP